MFVAKSLPPYVLSNTTAILIFAQPAVFDAGCKRFGSQSPGSRRVLDQLNRRIGQTAKATKLPVLHSTGLIKHVGSFGGQLTNALRATFALGFERVLVIGNDCPALTTTHLTQAANQLQSTPMVLGPDHRGGLYLFGLTRAVFEGVSMASLPWQTDRLAWAVRRVCAPWPVDWLPRLGDVNNRTDLQHYRTTSPGVALFINRLLTLGTPEQTRRFGHCPVRPFMVYTGGSVSLRAPPHPCVVPIAA